MTLEERVLVLEGQVLVLRSDIIELRAMRGDIAFPDYPEPLRPDAYPRRKPRSTGILRQKVRGLD